MSYQPAEPRASKKNGSLLSKAFLVRMLTSPPIILLPVGSVFWLNQTLTGPLLA